MEVFEAGVESVAGESCRLGVLNRLKITLSQGGDSEETERFSSTCLRSTAMKFTMFKKLLLILGFFSALFCDAQTIKHFNADTTKETQFLVITLPDTLKHSIISTDKSNSVLPSQMPWVIALIIGILSAVVNIWISSLLRKSNERNIESQLKNSRDLLFQELQSKLDAEKRQNWIDKLRLDLSECISYGTSLNMILVADELDAEKLKSYLEKFTLSKTKVLLLLNDQIVEHSELIYALESLESGFYKPKDKIGSHFSQATHNLILKGQILLKIHLNYVNPKS